MYDISSSVSYSRSSFLYPICMLSFVLAFSQILKDTIKPWRFGFKNSTGSSWSLCPNFWPLGCIFPLPVYVRNQPRIRVKLMSRWDSLLFDPLISWNFPLTSRYSSISRFQPLSFSPSKTTISLWGIFYENWKVPAEETLDKCEVHCVSNLPVNESSPVSFCLGLFSSTFNNCVCFLLFCSVYMRY